MKDALFLIIVLGAILAVVVGVAVGALIEWRRECKQQRLQAWRQATHR